jgi:regulatory protein
MADSTPTRADVEAAALTYLARRDHSESELRTKLKRKDFDDALINDVIADFQDRGYLDDERFAVDQGLILARKKWGPLQIAHKLSQHGIPRSIVDQAMADIDDEVDWHALAIRRLESKFRTDRMDVKTRAKAYRHLLNRGFPSELIRRILSAYPVP